jgi:soluble lytic murein transglycosylase-like protein
VSQAPATGGNYCRTWTANGGSYWACLPGASGLPGDPGPGGGQAAAPARTAAPAPAATSQQAAAPAATSQQAAAPAATSQQAAAPAATSQQAAAPAPAASTASTGGSSSQIIEQAFGPYGPAAVAWGQRVAACESGGSATARNASGATGLFQFMPSTFESTPQGQAGASITDPVASAQAAAWMYSQGQQSQWSCS